jgi:hypothetical protein
VPVPAAVLVGGALLAAAAIGPWLARVTVRVPVPPWCWMGSTWRSTGCPTG